MEGLFVPPPLSHPSLTGLPAHQTDPPIPSHNTTQHLLPQLYYIHISIDHIPAHYNCYVTYLLLTSRVTGSLLMLILNTGIPYIIYRYI